MKHCRGKPYRYDNDFRMMTSVSRAAVACSVTLSGVALAAVSAGVGIAGSLAGSEVMATK